MFRLNRTGSNAVAALIRTFAIFVLITACLRNSAAQGAPPAVWSFSPIPQPYRVAYSAQGNLLAVAGNYGYAAAYGGIVQVWNTATGTLVNQFDYSGGGSVYAAAFSPDGSELLIGGQSSSAAGALSLWNVATGKLIESFDVGANANVYSVAFSPDGDTVAAGGNHDTEGSNPYLLQLWSASSGKMLQDLNPGSPSIIYGLAFSPDGTNLAAGGSLNGSMSSTGILSLWTVSTGKPIFSAFSNTGVNSVAYSPDGTTLATAETNYVNNQDTGIIHLWSPLSGNVTATLPTLATTAVITLAYSADGKILGDAGANSTGSVVETWSTAGAYSRIGSSTSAITDIFSVAVSADDSTLAVAGYYVNSGTNATAPGLELRDAHSCALSTTMNNAGAHVECTALSPDGKTLAIGGYYETASNNVGMLELWNSVTGVRLKAFNASAYMEVEALAFSPDGASLAVGGVNASAMGLLQQISTTSGATIQSFQTTATAVQSVAFTPKGDSLASGGVIGHTGIVELWSVGTGKYITTIPTNASMYVSCVRFSQDGTMLADSGEQNPASGNASGIVELWAVPSGNALRSYTLSTLVAFTPTVTFSPNGKDLAAGSSGFVDWPGEIDVWRLSDGGRILSVQMPLNHGYNSLAYTPDGKYLFGGTQTTLDIVSTANLGITQYYDQGTTSAGNLAMSPDGSFFCYTNGSGGVTAAFNRYYPLPQVASVKLTPSQVTGGQTFSGTVTLASAAPLVGIPIPLASSNTKFCIVPAVVTVAAGAKSATFTGSTMPVTTSTSITISAAGGGKTATATLKLLPPAVKSAAIAPGSVVGGTSSVLTVTLNTPAPTGGTAVALSSSSSMVSVPSKVTVPAGATSATATITTKAVASKTTVTVTASAGGASATAGITVQPPAAASVAASPNPAAGKLACTGTVTLSGPAPAGGVAVQLTSSSTAIASCPATVTVPAGSTSKTFAITTYAVTAQKSVTLTASYNGKASATLIVQPAIIASLTLSASSVSGGQTVSGTITLSGPAPSAMTVHLTSSSTVATLASSVTIPAGATSGTFGIATTQPSSGSVQVTITAKLYASTAAAQLTVNQ